MKDFLLLIKKRVARLPREVFAVLKIFVAFSIVLVGLNGKVHADIIDTIFKPVPEEKNLACEGIVSLRDYTVARHECRTIARVKEYPCGNYMDKESQWWDESWYLSCYKKLSKFENKNDYGEIHYHSKIGGVRPYAVRNLWKLENWGLMIVHEPEVFSKVYGEFVSGAALGKMLLDFKIPIEHANLFLFQAIQISESAMGPINSQYLRSYSPIPKKDGVAHKFESYRAAFICEMSKHQMAGPAYEGVGGWDLYKGAEDYRNELLIAKGKDINGAGVEFYKEAKYLIDSRYPGYYSVTSLSARGLDRWSTSKFPTVSGLYPEGDLIDYQRVFVELSQKEAALGRVASSEFLNVIAATFAPITVTGSGSVIYKPYDSARYGKHDNAMKNRFLFSMTAKNRISVRTQEVDLTNNMQRKYWDEDIEEVVAGKRVPLSAELQNEVNDLQRRLYKINQDIATQQGWVGASGSAPSGFTGYSCDTQGNNCSANYQGGGGSESLVSASARKNIRGLEATRDELKAQLNQIWQSQPAPEPDKTVRRTKRHYYQEDLYSHSQVNVLQLGSVELSFAVSADAKLKENAQIRVYNSIAQQFPAYLFELVEKALPELVGKLPAPLIEDDLETRMRAWSSLERVPEKEVDEVLKQIIQRYKS